MKSLAHGTLNLICTAALGSIALGLAAPHAHAFSKSGMIRLLGGYNDNVDLQPDGDPDHEGSLLGRASISAGFNWDTGSGDTFYVSLINDDILYLTSGEASSIYLQATPGFRFKAMGGRLHTDVSFHLISNTAFEDSDIQDDARTSLVRTTKPYIGGVTPEAIGSPSTYFGQELRLISLYNFGGFRAGPALRWARTDYSKVPQDDTLLVLAGRVVIPFSGQVEAMFEGGLADNDSNVMGAGFSGPLLGAAIDFTLSDGFALGGSYEYAFRDFEDPSTREDRNHTFKFSLEKRLAGARTFAFEYRHISNGSTSAGAEYDANVISAGMRWPLF